MDQVLKPWVNIDNVGGRVGREVTLKGWVYNKRSSGKVRFLLIRDGTGFIQAVVSRDDLPEETFEKFDLLPRESSIIVTGVVREDRRAPGGYELALTGLEVVHLSDEYPISPKEHGPDFLLRHRHLWLRSRRQRAIMLIRAELIRAVRDFFDSRGFVLLDTPVLTPTSCEGTTSLFATEYFEHGPAYLTQSGQLYAEAGAMALGRVYTFGPTFRAEKSKTRRHLTEFWMVEPEMAYADLDDIMDLAEELISDFTARILETRRAELEVLERDTAALEKIRRPFVRMSYDQALKRLQNLGGGPEWGQDLGAPDETLLSKEHDRPILVHRYPLAAKAFYMKPDPADNRLALCVDVLAPEGYGEIIGGSQREDELEALVGRMEADGIPQEPLEWYLDLRRYGSAPHAGFGLGLERTVAWLCGLKHVREAIPFPRLMDRLYP
ncbi:MAG: asparagine--tRNA ligase [Thermodesulfobacteriota bacterium]|nr:asparagine--tRNA ligase [Thermodesulfobacteriota bacterium]